MASKSFHIAHPRTRDDDDGAALAIALVFMLVVGILITAALNKSGAVLKTDLAVRNQAQLQYAADAGVDRAIQILSSDVAPAHLPAKFCKKKSASSTSMTDPANGAQDPGGLEFNSDLSDSGSPHGPITVQYGCQTIQGSTPDPSTESTNNYAIVTTAGTATGFNPPSGSTANTLTSSLGSGKDMKVEGAIYVAGNEQAADLKKKIAIQDASLVEFDGGDFDACMDDLDAVTRITVPGPPNSKTCGAQTPGEAVPDVTIPEDAPDAAPDPIDYPVDAPTPKDVTCRIFLPGTYTSPPALLDGDNKDGSNANYFVSGLYNFQNVDLTVSGGEVLLGGQPNPDTNPHPGTTEPDVTAGVQPEKTGCKHFATLSDSALATALAAVFTAAGVSPEGVWEHGSLWVMGGTSSLSLSNGALSLYTPDHPADEPPTSLIAARSDQWFDSGVTTDDSLGYDPWDDVGQRLIDVQGGGNNVEMTVNGKIVAPDAPMSLTATENTTAVARSGVVGSFVDINASAAVGGGSFSFQACCGSTITTQSAQRRTVKVTSTATAADGSTFSETAVATIDNFGDRPVRVYSWRAGS